MSTYINAVNLEGIDGAGRVDFANRSEVLDRLARDLPGRREGLVLVTLDGDEGEYHGVEVEALQISDLTTLRRAIAVLQHAHDELALLYGDRRPVGRCTHVGDWGRCARSEDHAPGEHSTPTREQRETHRKALGADLVPVKANR